MNVNSPSLRVLLLVSIPVLTTNCAITHSTLQTEDGAIMKNWAIATTGSKITGRDLHQTYRGKTPENYEWEATTGESTNELSAKSEAIALLLRLFAESSAP